MSSPLAPLVLVLLAQDRPDVAAELEAIRAEAGLPALGAALVTREGLQGVWTAGTRRASGAERVTEVDRWHLGSCTKAMTATLVALLVARGDLAWETPLGETLAELVDEIDLDFGDVTLPLLLGHRAGLPANPDFGVQLMMRASTAPLMEQRAAVLAAVLSNPPVHAVGENFLYSNTGFILAGHLAERATGRSWEELMRAFLFEPLGMASAGFGPPGRDESGVTQPRGHDAEGRPVEPGPGADNPAALGPAGTVHAALADWAKFAQLHLAGALGDVQVGQLTLRRADFERLHSPLAGPGQPYGYGWVVRERPWAGGDGKALWHNGSNTMWFCEAWLGLANGVGILVTTNAPPDKASAAADRAAECVVREHERRMSRPAR
jgi:CubicO group peptidase (beta-lactamase class C family)